MANITKELDVPIKDGEIISLAMGAVKIFRGGAVGIVKGTGYAIKFAQATAAMMFCGFAAETVDNSGGSAGDKRILVRRRGVVECTQTGLAVTDIGAYAYLSDDQTLTTTSGPVCVGRIIGLDASSGKALIDMDDKFESHRSLEMSWGIPLHASKVIHNLLVAREALEVVGLDYTPDIAQGGALTATIVKATGTATPASATTPMHAAAAIDLNAAAHTVQPLTLTATVADLKLAVGDRMAIVLSGAMTTGSGNVSARLKRLG